MRLFKLVVLLAMLTAAAAVAAQADPGRNVEAVLRPVAGGAGFGLVKFRQPKDDETIVELGVWVRDLLPDHSYRLQRATDTTLDDSCTGTNWLTLGRGLEAAAVETDGRGSGRAELFRELPAAATGTEFDIHFRLIDDAGSAVVLESSCYRYTASQ